MQHKLHGRQVVPPSLWRLQRVSERHHAERKEPAELRAVCPQVRKRFRIRSMCCIKGQTDRPELLWTDFLCLFRDDGLSNSQAHIALNDHTSLFHETKELDGITRFLFLSFTSTAMIITTTSTCPLCLCADRDSDSDSDLSLEDDQSGSYASTHSSDSEDEEGPLPPEECWENLASNVAKRAPPHGTGAHLSPPRLCNHLDEKLNHLLHKQKIYNLFTKMQLLFLIQTKIKNCPCSICKAKIVMFFFF